MRRAWSWHAAVGGPGNDCPLGSGGRGNSPLTWPRCSGYAAQQSGPAVRQHPGPWRHLVEQVMRFVF